MGTSYESKRALLAVGAWALATGSTREVWAQVRACDDASMTALDALLGGVCASATEGGALAVCAEELLALQSRAPCAEVSFALASARREQRRCASAATTLEPFVTGPTTLREGLVTAMRDVHRQSVSCRATVVLRAPRRVALRVSVDGVASTPEGGTLYLDEGARHIAVDVDGCVRHEFELRVAAGERREITLPLRCAGTSTATISRSSPLRTVGWITLATGAAALIAGSVSWALSSENAAAMENACERGDADATALCARRHALGSAAGYRDVCASDLALCARQDELQGMAWGLGLGGVVAIATGAVLLGVAPRGPVAVSIRPSSGAIVWRF